MKDIKAIISAVIILTMVVVSACELKRSNPLDPESHDVPDRVVGLRASGSGAGVLTKYAALTWNKNQNNTDGYYVYMGLAYNSAYERVGSIGNSASADSTISYQVYVDAPGYYYFKVSAYKYYGNKPSVPNPMEDDSDFLEGSYSEWAIAHVNN